MTPTHVYSALSDYLDGLLDKPATERVKSHMLFCNPCRDQLEELKKTISVIKSLPVFSPPDNMETEIIAYILSDANEIKSTPPAPIAQPPSKFPGRTIAIIAASLIALGLVWKIRGSVHIDSVVDKPSLPKKTELPSPPPAPKPVDKPKPVQPAKVEAPVDKPSEEEKVEDQKIFEGLNGPMSGINTPLEQLISTNSDWKKLWDSQLNRQFPRTTVPSVNFEKNNVIAIFLGKKPSAGYSVEIERILETDWNGKPARVVRYREIQPNSKAFTSSVITTPFLMKTVPLFNGPTFFRRIP